MRAVRPAPGRADVFRHDDLPARRAFETIATRKTWLDCHAINTTTQSQEVCAQPYVGVRETGAVYTSHGPACTDELAPGAGDAIQVALDLNRELCRPSRGGCVIRVVPLRGDQPDSTAVVELARGLEMEARAPGRDHATVGECQSLLDTWRGDPAFAKYAPYLLRRDDLLAFCIGLSRSELACLREARSSGQADRCAP